MNGQEPRPRLFPPVISFLLISNILMFLLQLFAFEPLLVHFALWPAGTPEVIEQDGQLVRVPPFEVWQLLTYGFLHGGLLHLFLNLFAMWMLGVQLENAWGSRLFAVYFLVCVIGAGLIQLAVASYGVMNDEIYPTIGASGGVFGILLAFGMMFPNQRLIFLLLPVPIRAKYFVIGYGAFELFAGITGTVAGIAHFAHLGGMLFGFLLIQYWRGKLPLRPRRRVFWW
ncbi:rhomboid family intramembrane serine protease [Thioalkalivibrio paradoxus]|uniref:Membrane protein n=1 Tax=Thioalkalivibrio paradoxus ARh 1 TaxID=713585 RepID=W0DHP2_9GAMM|nr:rhomboid family intramembrane serine protease [Thioalkalivibrio paradoxus]AHE98144.1 membrane protein [Thioalkalivibrio paradoxus ARh 1]